MTTRAVLSVLVATAIVLWLAASALAAFPGRNGLIAFDRSKGGVSDIWVLDPKSGKETDVTRTPRIFEREAAFSPDGRTIAFAWQDYVDNRYGIGVIGSDGRGMRHLVSGDWFIDEPAWTADGGTVVFSARSDEEIGQSIWAVAASGGPARRLTFGGDDGSDRFPLGSPDGRHIAYLHDDFLDPPAELIAEPSGQDPMLAAGQAASDWSPDGGRFVYESRHAIYASAIDGSGELKLADLPTVDEDPAFSPDGKWVVWTNEGTHDLWLVPAAGGRPRNLTRQVGFEHDPSWGRAVTVKQRKPRRHHRS
jgi:Tol biopolymer transport system component